MSLHLGNHVADITSAPSRDLEFEHGFRACSFKIKRNKSDFHIVGGQQKQKKCKNDEMGQILVSVALDDTKTIGKAGADIFANFGAEKPYKKHEKFMMFPGFFPICPVDLA